MSNTILSLRRKLNKAQELQSVVRTMKALAASNIEQYEQSVRALGDYNHTVELGLCVCFRNSGLAEIPAQNPTRESPSIHAIVFGSDQGLVGQFNDVVVEDALQILSRQPERTHVWAVGERVFERLTDAGMRPVGYFPVSNSIKAVTPLIGQILMASEAHNHRGANTEMYLFYNRATSSATYSPVRQRLLPLDETWRKNLATQPWPNTTCLPEVLGTPTTNLSALIREYLFVSLFRACAESLASENASRLSAMQRADKNIEELLESLNRQYHHMRQNDIDEELFDVISGFEALNQKSSGS